MKTIFEPGDRVVVESTGVAATVLAHGGVDPVVLSNGVTALSTDLALLYPGDLLYSGVAPVSAETHDDDHRFEVAFDAALWFEQASDQAIVDLAKCGWGCDYAADDVAEFFRDSNPRVANMFDCKNSGFECNVEEDEAYAWIKANKPALLPALAEYWNSVDIED